MEDLRAKGGIFRHGGPHRAYGVDNSTAYNDGSLGQVNPMVAQCRARCRQKGTPTTRCVADCIKKAPLLGVERTAAMSVGALVVFGLVLYGAYKIAPK